MHSEIFKVLIGLLTGDPALPILWKLFLSDLSMMPDMDDVFLAGVRISLMAQGDDLLIISLPPRGMCLSCQLWKNGVPHILSWLDQDKLF
jgi:hypothetical protein